MGFVQLTHEQAAEQHALRRLFQRVGFAITAAEYRVLCAMCADGRAPSLGAARSGNTLHHVVVRGKDLAVIYSKEIGAILTFLHRHQPRELRTERRHALR
jgi:hypothetical protein